MKVVRAKNMDTANQFYNSLKFAQAMCNLEECFEIIKDYGGIQIKDQLVTSSPFFKKLQTINCQAKIDCLCKDLELKPRQKIKDAVWFICDLSKQRLSQMQLTWNRLK